MNFIVYCCTKKCHNTRIRVYQSIAWFGSARFGYVICSWNVAHVHKRHRQANYTNKIPKLKKIEQNFKRKTRAGLMFFSYFEIERTDEKKKPKQATQHNVKWGLWSRKLENFDFTCGPVNVILYLLNYSPSHGIETQTHTNTHESVEALQINRTFSCICI